LQKIVKRTERDEQANDGTNVDASTGHEEMSPNHLDATQPRGELQTPKQVKVDAYLASLRETGRAPSIADIEKFKPKRRPSSDSPNYPAAYKNLLERLCKSFTKSQLRSLAKSYGLDIKWTRYGRKQAEYAECIMEKQWGWENLKEVIRRKRDLSEMLTRCTPCKCY
jgi:hypothetical protein